MRWLRAMLRRRFASHRAGSHREASPHEDSPRGRLEGRHEALRRAGRGGDPMELGRLRTLAASRTRAGQSKFGR